jgi:hypothetical protein
MRFAHRGPSPDSDFSVDHSVRLEAGDQERIRRLIRCFLRCPFNQARMIEVAEAGKVMYKSDHNQVRRFSELGHSDSILGCRAVLAPGQR